MEKVDIKKVRCQAKVVGTIVTVAGAMLMTLYKGHVINLVWSNPSSNVANATQDSANDKDWFKGSILLIFATLAWAAFFILQVYIYQIYNRFNLLHSTPLCLLLLLRNSPCYF